jgi:hypothetical protein
MATPGRSDLDTLLPNAVWRTQKDTLARASNVHRTLREWLACHTGRHEWMLDGGSSDEPRYVADPPRYFCARPFCKALKGQW